MELEESFNEWCKLETENINYHKNIKRRLTQQIVEIIKTDSHHDTQAHTHVHSSDKCYYCNTIIIGTFFAMIIGQMFMN
jgi:hypothetical protein